MKLVIDSTGGPVPDGAIGELEARLGRKLPDDYRQFLAAHNARELTPHQIPISNVAHSSTVSVREVCCFCPGQPCDINYTYRTYAHRLPKGFFPIASDPGGNLFIMSLNDASYGAIFFWDHENEADDGNEPHMDNVYPLAPTWSDFIAMLS